MVTTYEFTPAIPLKPFIRCYVYREFDTNGSDIIKPWYASVEPSIQFFFKALPVKLISAENGKTLKTGKPCDLLGMSSQYNGNMCFNGAYSFFQILFKPDGFNKLFKIPSAHVINQIINIDDIFDATIKLLHEQLYDADNSIEMAKLADAFLLSYLKKQKTFNNEDGVDAAIHSIIKNAGFISIDKLAKNANMSLRNFERSFYIRTGMPAKLLCCVTRFNNAIELKLHTIKMDWTSIAHQTGYFDQMHLIKDFKRFGGNTPKTFLKDTFLFDEDYIMNNDK